MTSSSGGGRSIVTLTHCQGERSAPKAKPSAPLRAGTGCHYPARPPMDHFAGDLSPADFDSLLDQPKGPAVLVHGGAGTNPAHDPAPYFAGTRAAAEAGLRVLLQGG